MKTIGIYFQIIILTALFQQVNVYGQTGDNLKKEKLIEAAKEIINSASTCTLITLDKEGAPRARAMDPFPVEEDLTVWFGTNPNSRKIKQIKNDSRVTLYYLSDDESGYVVISGLATLVNNQITKDKYWRKSWEAFYPDNKDSYLLIKVVPLWLEILSPPHNIYNDSITWEPSLIKF